jgi:exonuclease VII small subunit
MPADYNVQIVAVDSAMDCYERVSAAASDLRAAATFDLASIGDGITRSLFEKERSLDDAMAALAEAEQARDELLSSQQDDDDDDGYQDSGCDVSAYDEEIAELEETIAKLENQIARLGDLRLRQSAIAEEWQSRSSALIGGIQESETAGKRMMAAYIRKIQGVDGAVLEGGMATNPYTGQGGYVVVTIDSQKYPETAEHIRVATREGHPSYLTLDRSGSATRRQQSLAGIRARGADGFDRDEYPPAAFSEGGTGAHVTYMSSSDNRGSGSSFARQLEGMPNGTRVRFRVI